MPFSPDGRPYVPVMPSWVSQTDTQLGITGSRARKNRPGHSKENTPVGLIGIVRQTPGTHLPSSPTQQEPTRRLVAMTPEEVR